MADKKISEDYSSNPFTWNGTEVLPGIKAGVNGAGLVSGLATYILSGLGTVALLAADTDGTLAANSDSRVATQKATKTAIAAAVAALVGAAPGALDTLKELADAINDDASYAATITAALALKAPLASPALTGTPTAPTALTADSSTTLATTAFVHAAVTAGGFGTGDVVGPSSATNLHLVVFDGTTGKLVKDGGAAPTGTNTGDQTTITGNAGTATALQTARTIGGVSFDGTANITQPFDVQAFYPGIPTASAKVARIPIARAVTFAGNFAGSYFTASANATATTVFDVQKNGSSIGSISIAAGGTTATFTTTSGTSKSFAAGDVLMIVCPASPDTTLADPGFALVGTR